MDPQTAWVSACHVDALLPLCQRFLLSRTSLAPTPHCSFGLSPSPSPQTGSPSHQYPLPSVWLAPFRFSHMTPQSPRFLLSGWLRFTQMPPNHCPMLHHPWSTSVMSLFLLLSLWFPRAVPPHRCLARFATAVSPCATTKCCLQLQGRAGGGVRRGALLVTVAGS